MKEISKQIRFVVASAENKLHRITDDEAGNKPNPGKWSKKEILGHLIDSAANNHQRFVRAVYNKADSFPLYNQDDWVRIQQYNNSSWELLIDFWSVYNRHLSDLIERIPEEAKSSLCNFAEPQPVALEFVITDYLRHLKHHVDQLIA